jgi:hypothetical protein
VFVSQVIGDVVENVVTRETFRLSIEDASDELRAAPVVIEEIRREADRRIRDSVEYLRPQPHLKAVSDPFRIDEAQSLVSDPLVV